MNETRKQIPPEAMSFRELADAIANGQIIGTPTFNLFLQKGVDYWKIEAEKPGPFQETYLCLVTKYTEALHGNNKDRRSFCEDEATYLFTLAQRMENGGADTKQTHELIVRAENWLRVTMNFTLTGEDFAEL